MKNFWIAVLIALAPDGYAAEPRLLHFNYNEIVTISISNSPCPLAKLAKTHPYTAIAVKYADKNHDRVLDALNACWTHKGDDIEIQWVGGDKTYFPANYFLIKDTI